MSADTLRLRRLGIDTYTDPVVFMRRDCHVCPDALGALREAGVERIVTTNTIAHETNAIDVSELVAESTGELWP